MPSRSDTDELRAEYLAIRRLVERDLTELWGSLDLSRPEAARDALLVLVPALVDSYGSAASAVAAEWYDDMRAGEGVRGRFRAVAQESPYSDAVEPTVRRAAGALWTDAPSAGLSPLVAKAPKYALAAGRQTVTRSSDLDPRARGWKRVTRANACKFCLLLAGRGAVYAEGSVHFASHDDCNCASSPEWDPDAPEVDAPVYAASVRTTRMTPAERHQHNLGVQRAIREYVE